MAFMHQLMVSLGIGAAQASLQVEGMRHHRGDWVNCEVTLTGGELPQKVETLSLELVRWKQMGKSRVAEVLKTEIMAQQFTIHPGENQTHACRFFLSDDAPLSGAFSNDMEIRADADILAAINRRDSVDLNVVPHKEFFAVVGAMKELGFMLRGEPTVGWLDGMFHAKFAPNAETQAQLEAVGLNLSLEARTVHGWLLLDYPEKSAMETAKALLGMNELEVPLDIPRQILVDAEGKMTPENLVPLLKQTLAQSLILPDNPEQWMLRASQAPAVKNEELLRPASDTGATRPDELLRSASERKE